MEKRTALVAGASGLVGGRLTEKLLSSSIYASVVLLVRRPLAIENSRLQQVIADFDNLDALKLNLQIDDVYCALGTTIKAAGSQEAFRKVDFAYVKNLLDWSNRNGAQRFMVVSAMGASAASGIFYNRVKGEMEAVVQQSQIAERHIFRPSLLMGRRTEHRFGEMLAQRFMQVFGFLFAGPFLKYKGILADRVALSMIRAAASGTRGCTVHLSDEMQSA